MTYSLDHVQLSPAIAFIAASRRVADEARRLGLTVPAVHVPPHRDDVDRAIKGTGKDATLYVRIRDREPTALARDLAEGTLVVNGLPLDHEYREVLIAAAEEPDA